MSDVESREEAATKGRGEVAVRPERVEEIRATIDFSDRISLSAFGEQAQREATAFSERILAASSGRRDDDPDAVLASMLEKARQLDPNAVARPKSIFARLFDKPEQRISRFRDQYSEVAGSIDNMAVNIERQKEALRSDVMTLEGLFAETIKSIRDLDEHVLASEDAIREMREKTIPALNAKVEEAADKTLAIQDAMDAEQAADRLEKRAMQLHQARQIALQQLPQIRIIQSGNETLMQNLDSALTLTIPAWKQKMVVVLGLARQGRALATDRALSTATGQMMKETAALIGRQAHEIEDRSQQGIVDVAAIEEVNAILIDAISGVMRKQAEGRASRKEAIARIGTMRRELEAVISTQ